MSVRRFTFADTGSAMTLYRDLAGRQPLADTSAFEAVLAHPGTDVFGVWDDGEAVAMATLHILPNMTQGGRPYALVENVVTRTDHRGTGQGRRVMEAVIAAAWEADCYKIMLMTGRTAQARGFYEALGFSTDEKWGMSLRRAPVRNPAG